MFVYCNNCPPNLSDSAGNRPVSELERFGKTSLPVPPRKKEKTAINNTPSYDGSQSTGGATYNYYGDGYTFNYSTSPPNDATYNFYGDNYIFNFGIGKESNDTTTSADQIPWDTISTYVTTRIETAAFSRELGAGILSAVSAILAAGGVSGPAALVTGLLGARLAVEAIVLNGVSDFLKRVMEG